MVKKQTMLTIDSALVEEAKLNRINMSQVAEDALRSHLGVISGNVNNLDLQISRKKLQKIEKNILMNTGEATKLRENIRAIEESMEKEQEEQLNLAKKKIEDQQKCVSCGYDVPPDAIYTKTASGKILCRTCLLSGKDPTKM